MFVRVVLELTCRMWLGCHILAAEFFGGVPRRIVR
jgi:transposase